MIYARGACLAFLSAALLSTAGDSRAQMQPGTAFRDCPECPELVVIPAGTFMMGAPETEQGRSKFETPQRQVAVNQPFALGKFEVTVGEYATFVRESGHRSARECGVFNERKQEMDLREGQDLWRNPGFSQTDRHPVICVSWDDANAYVQWLSRKTGKPYRLPSEAEWEYVARAGTSGAYYWGELSAVCRHENARDNSAKQVFRDPESFPCDDGNPRTAPVGTFAANRFGIHDTVGNAAEWVADCWFDSYSGAPADAAPRRAEACSRVVYRGAGWKAIAEALRSAQRMFAEKGDAHSSLGFRVARSF